MASSIFPTANTVTPIQTATGGALSGDGSSGNKLAVTVDGASIGVNGSDQLEAIGMSGATDGELLYNDGGGFDGIAGSNWNGSGKLSLLVSGTTRWLNVGDTNVATASGTVNQVLQLGNGLSVTHAAGAVDNTTQIGASIVLTLTDAGSSADGTFIGEHITVTDENGPQQYGLGLAGGGADINVLGGKEWTVIAAGTENINADYLEGGLIIGQAIDVVNASGTRSGIAVIGNDITITNSAGAYAFGMSSVAITDVTVGAGSFGAMALGASSTIDGNESFDTLFTFGYGHSLSASANQQMLIGFDGTTLPASEAVGIGVSATPEVVITAGATTFTGFLQGTEQVAPSAPAANGFRIYAVDNGGKTELLALFNSGAAQRIAIQP